VAHFVSAALTLGFQLQLDADHPYVAARVPVSLVTPNGRPLRDVFGVGLCQKGSMAGRVCVPIHNTDGNLVGYAGRWTGEPETLPEGEEKWKLPKLPLHDLQAEPVAATMAR